MTQVALILQAPPPLRWSARSRLSAHDHWPLFLFYAQLRSILWNRPCRSAPVDASKKKECRVSGNFFMFYVTIVFLGRDPGWIPVSDTVHNAHSHRIATGGDSPAITGRGSPLRPIRKWRWVLGMERDERAIARPERLHYANNFVLCPLTYLL